MRTFYTITSGHTQATNDKSTRHMSMGAAVTAATLRLTEKPEVESVVILKSIKLIKRDRPPIIQEDMEPEDLGD